MVKQVWQTDDGSIFETEAQAKEWHEHCILITKWKNILHQAANAYLMDEPVDRDGDIRSERDLFKDDMLPHIAKHLAEEGYHAI
jgi:hypothetical protein